MLETLYVLDLRLTAAWPCDSPRSVPCDAGRNGPDLLRAVGALRHQSETVVPRADTCSTVCMCSICDWLPRGRATGPRSVPRDAGQNGPDLLRAVGALRHQSETLVPREDTCSTICMCSIGDWLPRGRATAPAASRAMRGKMGPICYEQWARSDIKVRPSYPTRRHMLDSLYVLDLRLAAARPCDSPRSVPRDADRNGPDFLRAVGALKHQSETVIPRTNTCSTVCMCSICD